MSKTNAFENDMLDHFFTNLGINTGGTWPLYGVGIPTNFYIGLFTADPGEAGSFTNEADYSGYQRVGINRSIIGWTVSGNQVSNTAAVTFNQCTGGNNTITHFAICETIAGTNMYYSGALGSSESVTSGITPSFAIGSLIATED